MVETDRTLRMRELEAGEKHTQCYYKKQNSSDEAVSTAVTSPKLASWFVMLPSLQVQRGSLARTIPTAPCGG